MAVQLIKSPKPVKEIPKDQLTAPKVTYIDSRGVTYVITTDVFHKSYLCWRKDNGKYVKIATGETPLVLYDFIEKEQKKKYVPIESVTHD